ncbi:MAG: radical SAM protein [Bacilli bacterium]|nr:radical SAM protein [Bacilli bacterium]
MTELKKTNYIKIQDGCSQKCGYCVVREFRGPSVSESYQDIYNNVKSCIEDHGMKLLQLEGVNAIEYNDPEVGDLISLCERLLKDFPTVYFMVGQVNPFDEDKFKRLMDLIGSEERLLKTCLVPIQSASNTALARMHRPHTQEKLRELLNYAREKGVEFTIEIIPGFPGETEEEFMDTYNFLDEISPVAFWTHAFSARPGTEAASLPDQISEEVIVERMEKYKELQKKISARFKESLNGKEIMIITEPEHGSRTIHNIPVSGDFKNADHISKYVVLYEDGGLVKDQVNV